MSALRNALISSPRKIGESKHKVYRGTPIPELYDKLPNLAEDPQGIEVAMKRVRGQLTPKQAQKYGDLITLDQRNIIRYYGVINHTEHGFKAYDVFMEYVAGGSLEKLIKGNPVPDGALQNLTRQLLEGVAYLHDHKIVHKDIKPHNLLLTSRDFWTAALKIGDIDEMTRRKFTRTTQNSAVTYAGTELYSPPECFEPNYKPGRPWDIWGCGCVIIQMISGGAPLYSTKGHPAFFIGSGELPDLPGRATEIYTSKERKFLEFIIQRDPRNRRSARTLLLDEFLSTAVTDNPPLSTVKYSDSLLDAVKWRPDSRQIALAGIFGVHLWDMGSTTHENPLLDADHCVELNDPRIVQAIAWTRGYNMDSSLIAGNVFGQIGMWNYTGELLKQTRLPPDTQSEAIRHIGIFDADKLAAVCTPLSIFSWDLSSGNLKNLHTRSSNDKTDWIRHFDVHPTGVCAFAINRSANIAFVDATESWQEIKELEGHQKAVTGVAWSPCLNDQVLASCSEDGNVRLWRINANQQISVQDLKRYTNEVRVLTWGPVGCQRLASVAEPTVIGDLNLRVWDSQTAKCVVSFLSEKPVMKVSFGGNGNILAGIRKDTIRLWDLRAQTLAYKHVTKDVRLDDLSFDSTGQFLAVCGSSYLAVHDFKM